VAVGSLGTDESGDVTERTIKTVKKYYSIGNNQSDFIKRPQITYLLPGTKFEFDV
jgi:hypothetical protein